MPGPFRELPSRLIAKLRNRRTNAGQSSQPVIERLSSTNAASQPTKEQIARAGVLREGLRSSTYLNLDALEIRLREMYERQIVIESSSSLVINPYSVAPNNQPRPLNYRAEEGGEFTSVTAFKPSAEDKQKAGVTNDGLEVAGLKVTERTSRGSISYSLYFDISRAYVLDTNAQGDLANPKYERVSLISYGGYIHGVGAIRGR